MLVFGQFSGSIVVLALFGLIGFGIQGGFVGMYSLAARMYPTEIRATGVGWAVGAGRIGAVFGPLLGGFLIGAGFSMATNFMVFAIPTIKVSHYINIGSSWCINRKIATLYTI